MEQRGFLETDLIQICRLVGSHDHISPTFSRATLNEFLLLIDDVEYRARMESFGEVWKRGIYAVE